jgi:hypothetical protein
MHGIIIDGSEVALLSKRQLSLYLGSPDIAQRVISAHRLGDPSWISGGRSGRDTLVSAADARRAAERIASGQMPPQFPSRLPKAADGVLTDPKADQLSGNQ